MSDAGTPEGARAEAFLKEHENCDEYCSAACDAAPIIRDLLAALSRAAQGVPPPERLRQDLRQAVIERCDHDEGAWRCTYCRETADAVIAALGTL